ncbi:MAG: alpha-L-fucosidase [Clostridiales bacterium]|jgi:alpha-L-fucosidase|nr:alpha-L-fucosidase [Clostridiales bacterium]
MRFIPEMESIRQHVAPKWYNDAKFGIFIHWGPYSVPAWAPPTGELGSMPDDVWFENNPYAEWYMNSVRVGKGPTYERHVKTYGEDFPYERFVDMWQAESWNPAEWAALFKAAGARYVVPVTKHHDGFCLWDSAYTRYNSCRMGPRRDIAAELCRAVRAQGMRFGVYYSGLIDWRFAKWPMRNGYDVQHPDNIGYDYSDYAYNQFTELIDRFAPSLLFNDIGWPYKGEKDLPYLFAHYYNAVEDGVVDDRWNGVWHDYATKEYQSGAGNVDVEKKWEECRGIGLSFGYNQAEGDEHLLSPQNFVRLLAKTVAYNGNLLINVGPKADGTIPENQASRLRYMGEWLGRNGEAIYGTRPFERQEQPLEGGATAFFTRNDGNVYILLDGLPAGAASATIKGLGAAAKSGEAIGGARAALSASGDDLIIHASGVPEGSPAIAVRLAIPERTSK